jgi:hypothetical protein
MGESLVKTTDEPTARIIVHGQFAGHAAISELTTFTDVSGVPS